MKFTGQALIGFDGARARPERAFIGREHHDLVDTLDRMQSADIGLNIHDPRLRCRPGHSLVSGGGKIAHRRCVVPDNRDALDRIAAFQ